MIEERKPLAVVEDRIELATSPEVLWTCFADLGKWPAWFPALIEARWFYGSLDDRRAISPSAQVWLPLGQTDVNRYHHRDQSFSVRGLEVEHRRHGGSSRLPV